MQTARWHQWFDHFKPPPLGVLERGVALARQRPLSELEQRGLLQGFESTHELAWNLLQDVMWKGDWGNHWCARPG